MKREYAKVEPLFSESVQRLDQALGPLHEIYAVSALHCTTLLARNCSSINMRKLGFAMSLRSRKSVQVTQSRNPFQVTQSRNPFQVTQSLPIQYFIWQRYYGSMARQVMQST